MFKRRNDMENNKYKNIAEAIINAIGGANNVRSCQHCVTRLRFNVYDKGLVNQDEVSKIDGVIGTNWLGDQFQAVIGLDAKFVYKEVINMGISSFKDAGGAEGLGNRGIKGFFDAALDYISTTMTALIPIMVGAGLCKTIAVVLGPNLLKVISDTSDLYNLLMMISNAMMYFLPVLLGYTACKALGTNPLYGIFLGALLLAPDLRAKIGVEETFGVFFAKAPVADYSQAFLPVLLGCPILKYVLNFFEKYVPKLFSILLVPACTILVMVFVMFVICGPAGSFLGTLFGNLFTGIYEGNIVVRVLGSMVLCIAWPFLILLGMHLPIVQLGVISLFSIGYDTIIWPTAFAYSYVIMGIAFGAFLKLKNKEEKGMAFSAFITSFLGGISEPTIYGIIMKYKRGLVPIVLGCGLGGLLIGVFAPQLFNLAGLVNIVTLPIMFAGGSASNHAIGTAILAICLLAGVVSAFFLVDYENQK